MSTALMDELTTWCPNVAPTSDRFHPDWGSIAKRLSSAVCSALCCAGLSVPVWIWNPSLPAQQSALQTALDKRFAIEPHSGWNLSLLGATFGHQVVSSSIKAVDIALLLILLYVTFRFQWKFAIGAIGAEIHDLLIVVGIYSLTGREVTTATIAAVLTILGYSLYDTVIVFD